MSRDVTRSDASTSRLRIPGTTRLRSQRPRRPRHRIGGRGSLRSGPSTLGNRVDRHVAIRRTMTSLRGMQEDHVGADRTFHEIHGARSPGKPGPSGRDGPRRLPVARPRGTSATEPVGRIRRRHRTCPHREHGSSRTSGRREPTRGQALVRSSRRPPGGHRRRVNTAHCHRFRATRTLMSRRHHDGRHHVHLSVLRGAAGVGYPRVRQRGGQLALVRCPSVAVAHGRRAPVPDGPATKAGSSLGRPATNRPALLDSSRAARRRNWCLTGPRAAPRTP